MLPPLRTLEYAGACAQARQVGGDYYDFLNLGQQRLGFVVGDIAGKGISAALLMANLQANLRSQCAIADQPHRFLRSVNELFYDNTADSAYATLFFGEYSDKEGLLRYINCGHLAGIVLRSDDRLDRLEPTATVLGLFKDWDCTVEQRELFPGDALVLFTDGVTEALNDREEDFGEERLIQSLYRHRNLPPESLVGSVLDDVRGFSRGEQYDDMTLIVAQCRTGAD
jgi:serine phosphatase RsbU (regulator of sigma subunit)